jgi:hypothetical protein
MATASAALALVAICMSVSAAAAQPSEPSLAEVVTNACLEALGERPRGFVRVNTVGKAVLCLRGTVGHLDGQVGGAEFVQAAQDNAGKLDGLFFTSGGGDPWPWLEFAERIGEVEFVIVGGMCNSSCANYGFILGRRKIVLPGSVVAWHGGETADPAVARRFMRPAAPGEPIMNGGIVTKRPRNPIGRFFRHRRITTRFLDIGRRTEALYLRLGISARILSDTTDARPPQAIVDEVHRRYRPEEIEWVVLFPPDLLARCYGFSGLEEMWHPGGPEETMSFGLELLPPHGFVITTRDIGPDGCPAEPNGG